MGELTQGPIQADGGGDQGQVREGLGEISQGLSARPDLLGVEPEVVGVGEHLLQGEASLLQTSRTSEALDQPERTDAEGALPTRGSIICSLVAVHERVVGKLLLDAVQGGEPAGVGGSNELDHGHEQQRGVQSVGAVVLDEALLLQVPAVLHYLLVDGVLLFDPATYFGGES